MTRQRQFLALVSCGLLAALLVACGSGAPRAETGLVIAAPAANAQFVRGASFSVEGTAPLGAEVTVTVGTDAPVTATLLAPANERQPWRAELSIAEIGSHTVTVTASGSEMETLTAQRTVEIVQVQPFGWWDGIFYIDRRPNGGELEMGGSMMVRYSQNWFRMYFGAAAAEVEGTVDGWDLIDKDGLRLVGTFHPAGDTDQMGRVQSDEFVDFYVELSSGDLILGTVTQ